MNNVKLTKEIVETEMSKLGTKEDKKQNGEKSGRLLAGECIIYES